MSTREKQPPQTPPTSAPAEAQTAVTRAGERAPDPQPDAVQTADTAVSGAAPAALDAQEIVLQQILHQVTPGKRTATAAAEPPPPPLPARSGTAAPPADPGQIKAAVSPPLKPSEPSSASPDGHSPGSGAPADHGSGAGSGGGQGGGGNDGTGGSGPASGDSGDDPPMPPATLYDTVAEIAATTSRIEATTGQLAPLAQTVRASHELTTASAKNVASIKEELAQVSNQIHAEVGAAKDDLMNADREVRDSVAKVGRLLEEVRQEVSSYEAGVTPILQQAHRDRDELRSALTSAQRTLGETQHTAVETRREVQQLQQALDQSDGRALTHRDELRGELAETQKAVSLLVSKVDDRLTADIKAVAARLDEHAERTAPVLDEVKTHLAGVAGTLKDSIVPQGRASAEALERLADHTRQLDRHLRESQAQLQQSLDRDLRERLGHVATAATLSALSTQTERGLAEVHCKQAEAQKALDGLTAAVPADLAARLEKLSTGLGGLGAAAVSKDAIADVADRLEGIERSIGTALSEKLGQKLEQVQGAVAAAQKTLNTAATAAEVQSVKGDLQAIKRELQSALQLTETRLTNKLEAAAGLAQQAAAETAAQARGVEDLKMPVGEVQRSVGDALGYRLGVMHGDLKDLGEDIRSKLEVIAAEQVAAQNILAKTVVTGGEQTQAAAHALGAQVDRHSERLEAVITEVGKSMGRAVKERADALAQEVGELAGQQSQDQAALVQQLNQLRADLASPLQQIGTSVGTGLTQRMDSQAEAVAELRRGATEALGQLKTAVTAVAERADTIADDLSATRSAVGTLAAAVSTNQTALIGELVHIRTVTQEGLGGTLRAGTKDLADRLQRLDERVEARVDAVQRELGQLGRSGAHQHAQIVADVSAIRDLVRADSGTQGRLAESVSRKLEETQLRMTELTGDARLQHGEVLNTLGKVHGAVATGVQSLEKGQTAQAASLRDLEATIKDILLRLQNDIERDFETKLNSKVATIHDSARPIHSYINDLKDAAARTNFTLQVKDGLADRFHAIEEKLNPLNDIKKFIEYEIKSNSKELNEKVQKNKDVLDTLKFDMDVVTGKLKAEIPARNSFLVYLMVLLVAIPAITTGLASVFGNKGNDEKVKQLLEGQAKLTACSEDTKKLTCLVEKTAGKIGTGNEPLDAQLAEIKSLLAKNALRPAPKPSPRPGEPASTAPQFTNSISICSSCGSGGSGGSTVNCTCLGKTTTNKPAEETSTKNQKPAASAPSGSVSAATTVTN